MFWKRSARDKGSSRCPAARFRPAIEGLEQRCNPVNVTATVKSGLLTLRADVANSNDVITIQPAASGIPGNFDLVPSGTTTINNGVAATPFEARGVRSILATLKGGNDTVTFHGQLMNGLTFNGGSGANQLQIAAGSRLGGTARIVNGTNAPNNDTLIIDPGVVIGRSVIADFGAGGSATQLARVTVGGRLSVTAQAGNDQVLLADVTIGSSVTANLGDGGNFFLIDVLNDGITSNTGSFIGGSLKVFTGRGTDNIRMGAERPVTIGGKVTLSTGDETSGGDSIVIDDTTFLYSIFFDLGAGNDQALFETTDTPGNLLTRVSDKLTILGERGADTVAFGVFPFGAENKVFFRLKPALNGGGGLDTQDSFDYAINGVDNAEINSKNFETVP